MWLTIVLLRELRTTKRSVSESKFLMCNLFAFLAFLILLEMKKMQITLSIFINHTVAIICVLYLL